MGLFEHVGNFLDLARFIVIIFPSKIASFGYPPFLGGKPRGDTH